MTLPRARIVKATAVSSQPAATPRVQERPVARRIPAVVLDAHAEASAVRARAEEDARRILDEARAKVAHLADDAAREAREREVARVTAELLAVRAAEEKRRAGELDRTIAVATALAERVIGEGLRIEPERIGVLATEALREARGARHVRIEASAEDVAPLRDALAVLGAEVAEIVASEELGRGSLVVVTDLGRIDARLTPQLDRLAAALREVFAAPSIQGDR